MKRIILLTVLAMICAGGTAMAADATAALDLNSAYVWRGITFNDGMVAQPSLTVSKNGFGLNVWGNYDIDDYDGTVDDYDFSEIDLTPSYAFNISKLSVTVGLIDYLFPSSGAEGTVELFTSLGMPIIGGLSAGINFFYDVDEVQSFYTDLNLTYALSLTDALSAAVGAKAGYAGKDFATYYSAAATDGGFYDYGFSLGLTYAVSEGLSVGAKVNYTDSFDQDVLPDANIADGIYGHDVGFYGGVSVAYAF